MASGTGPDDGNFLTVWLAGLDYVACQGLSEIAKKALDRANRDGFIVLAPVAGLLARMVAHSTGNRREGHVFLNERIGVQILSALHEIEIALDFFVGSTGVIARGQLVSVHRSDGTPVSGGKQVLSLFLRWGRGDTGEGDGKPVRDVRALSRHRTLP